MIFWLSVLIGALFAWIAVRIGFYAAWILAFHLLLAACMAIFLTPVVVAGVPAATSICGFGHALTLLSIAVATLLIGYGACYACLAGRLQIPFPRLMDSVGAGILGFLTGFFVWSFLLLALTLTPPAHSALAQQLGFDAAARQTNMAYLCWWCNGLHYFISPGDDETTSRQAVDRLIAEAVPVTEAPPAELPPELPPPAPAIDGTATSYPSEEPAAREGTGGPSKTDLDRRKEPKRLPSDFPVAPLDGLKESPEKSTPPRAEEDPKNPRGKQPNPQAEENPADGPMTGAWISSGGAQFHIEDDGQTLSIELVSSDTLHSLSGRLDRRDAMFLKGTLDVIFMANPSKTYTIDVTVTVPDARHLRLRCVDWPRWNSHGKFLGASVLTEVWTRGHGVFAAPFRPQ